MSYPSLRRVAAAELRARAALAHWPRRDAALTGRLAYSPLPRHSGVVAVHAYAQGLCWRGHVDLREWLAITSPELASLACMGGRGDEHALALFDAAEQPLSMPFRALDYDCLRIQHDATSVTPAAPDTFASQPCLLSLRTPQGRVWFSDFPDIEAPVPGDLSRAAQALPLLLDWRIGSSQASSRLIGGLRRGDVLLITNEAFELSSAGTAIGRFSINQDGEITVQAASLKQLKETRITASANVGADADADAALSAMPATSTTPAAPATPTIAASLADIPLRLDFVLQRRLMTVAELDTLYRGQVLQLDPQAEKQVEITVNGMRLATGELVELNGRLGVELHDIAGGKAIAETHRV